MIIVSTWWVPQKESLRDMGLLYHPLGTPASNSLIFLWYRKLPGTVVALKGVMSQILTFWDKPLRQMWVHSGSTSRRVPAGVWPERWHLPMETTLLIDGLSAQEGPGRKQRDLVCKPKLLWAQGYLSQVGWGDLAQEKGVLSDWGQQASSQNLNCSGTLDGSYANHTKGDNNNILLIIY